MKVFISWSGSRSRAVAELLSDWIKCVIQATRPWISTRDIDRGSLWFSEINDQLKDTTVGIVCLTQDNKNKPWILFEAGALAKGLSSNRVCTFLIDLKPADLENPLAQFNHTLPERSSVWELIRTLNGCLGNNGLDERILEQVFSTYWDQFDTSFRKALEENLLSEEPEPRSEQNMLSEILDNTRVLGHRVRLLESRLDQDFGQRPVSASAMTEEDNRNVRALAEQWLKEGVPRSEIRRLLRDGGLSQGAIEQFLDALSNRQEPPGRVAF
jgi:hypothetical protein